MVQQEIIKKIRKGFIFFLVIALFAVLSLCFSVFWIWSTSNGQKHNSVKIRKLYWFIPDGMRADPYIFNIYEWARKGELPNIKRMMDNGSYGFCKPVYPGHTPANFATLATGTYPEVHGVSDGPMHTEGHPLVKPSVAGFSSTAKKVEPIWVTLEKQGRTVGVLSIPGSTPAELQNGFTLLGRWGGWGASFYAINFEELGDGNMLYQQGRHTRFFYSGPALAIFKHALLAQEWVTAPLSYSPAKEVLLEAWGAKIHAYIYDSTDDQKVDYNRVAFSVDKKEILADLREGECSNWLPVTLIWNDMKINTVFKIKIIKLREDGFYRIRLFYNNMNETVTNPDYLSEDIIKNIGPMVDSVDNFPPQLVFYNEDKSAFLQEADMSLKWHADIVPYFLKTYKPDVFLHAIYTPNQMLTSKWWMGYIDPDSPRYSEKTDKDREQLWKEVKGMYKKLDAIIGNYLENADDNTIIVVTADHGVAPLHTLVHLNNLFARKGWLEFKIDNSTGEPVIDWNKSRVVYLKFGNIYIRPSGLHGKDGNWYRASGRDYEKLRSEVIDTLKVLKDKNGITPVMKIVKWEEAKTKLRLPPDRVGDLIVANRPGYGWNEEMSQDKEIFSASLETGYKQAIISDDCPATWAPFIVMGPGVKKNYFLGNRPISIVNQYPTLMRLIGAEIPAFVQGKVLEEIFTEEFKKQLERK
jgi:predicted AlkP superfamily phosphohydrolase/phosphomutase